MNKYLKYYLYDRDGNQILIDQLPFLIGSGKNFCNLYLEDSEVSLVHATIDENLDDNTLIIKDENTATGTFLNELNISGSSPINLNNNDILKIGNTIFSFKVSDQFLTEVEIKKINSLYKNLCEDNQDLQSLNELNDLFRKKLDLLESYQEDISISKEPENIEKEKISSLESQEENEEILNSSDSFQNRQLNIENDIFAKPEEEKPVVNYIQQSNEILIKTPGFMGQTLKIRDLPFSIGKSGADYTFDKKGVSRIHAILDRDPETGRVKIFDQSTNGTFLNGSRVNANGSYLNNGDVIELFTHKFKVIQV